MVLFKTGEAKVSGEWLDLTDDFCLMIEVVIL
jgi:hypothetical protein